MRILGIETSCDETAAAIVENGTKILSSSVASSEEFHKKSLGIIPETAAREQLKSIIPVLDEVIKPLNHSTIDAIAVTVGPGLIGSLIIGVETARTLSWLWNKPIIPVNHLVAHLYANFLQFKNISFPAVGLVVSGGHTELVLLRNYGKITYLGGTRDDAAGECFDKTARILGLGYPGGPAIAATAAQFPISNSNYQFPIKLPRPMLNQDNFDFSFSGLKTAVLRVAKTNKPHLAYEIQEAITDVLVAKTLKASKKYQAKSILVGGGVAANSRLREKFSKSVNVFIPDPRLCTDNGAIIATAAYFNKKFTSWQKIKPNPGLEITDNL
jgi:N6-L-threonylcarbamoyladenine synthase